MVSFDGKEIGWVIDSNYDRASGTIQYNCLALGNTVYDEIGEVIEEYNYRVRYKGESIVYGPFKVKFEPDNRIILYGDNDEYPNNQFGVDDRLVCRVDDKVKSFQFSTDEMSGINLKAPQDITELFTEGWNDLYLTVADIYGGSIGCTGIKLLRFGGIDPREEISFWQSYEADVSSNPVTLNSQRFLQSSGNIAYELEDGFNSWNAVLAEVSFKEDSMSNKAITYSLTFIIGNAVFKDKYGKCFPPETWYPNILYQKNYISNTNPLREMDKQFGKINVVEWLPIKRIDIYGGAIRLPSWVEVNGVRKHWHYRLEDGVEKLTWNIPNLHELTIISPNIDGLATDKGFFGSELVAFCLDLIPNTMGIPIKDNAPIEDEPPVVNPPKPGDTTIPYDRHYYAPYPRYSNLEYYRWTSKTSYVPKQYHKALGAVDGKELGILIINEPYPVREVHIWGSGCVKPASISVNGQWKQWNCYHDSTPKCNETLKFKISPSKKIIIKTTIHDICPSNWGKCDRGAFVGIVRNIYDRSGN